jgi:hypothetical protein
MRHAPKQWTSVPACSTVVLETPSRPTQNEVSRRSGLEAVADCLLVAETAVKVAGQKTSA